MEIKYGVSNSNRRFVPEIMKGIMVASDKFKCIYDTKDIIITVPDDFTMEDAIYLGTYIGQIETMALTGH